MSMRILILLIVVHSLANLQAQPCNTLDIRLRAEIPSTCSEMTIAMKQDRIGRPYLYVAQKEGGLAIYDISTLSAPVLVKRIAISQLQNLHVMNLEQSGTYLYLALGNHFTNSQTPGCAVIDIADPVHATVSSTWKDNAGDGGAGIVKIESNNLYLGAMKHGVIVFDISNKSNLVEVSRYLPSLNFPDVKPDTAKINARGMEVRAGVVYLCFDAGGFRIIDFSDRSKPRETGRYSNPALNGHPRAYNNIVVDDTLAYIAVDYCGMEVLNIHDTANIRLQAWWDPWICETSGLNWFTSAGHANEIVLNKECSKIFLSTGKSDMYVLDVTNPSHPDSCGIYGGVDNNLGTWGIDVVKDRIYLSYICAIIPFASNWTGVKILNVNTCSANEVQSELLNNPTDQIIEGDGLIHFRSREPFHHPIIHLRNLMGAECTITTMKQSDTEIVLDATCLAHGCYSVEVVDGLRRVYGRVVLP